MGKAWRSLHMNKTRMRERMCITVIPTLRHTWTQEGLPITRSLEFFDLHTNSDSPTMVVKSPSVKFYKNPFTRFPVIICVKSDWQIKKTVIVASPNVKAHTVYSRFYPIVCSEQLTFFKGNIPFIPQKKDSLFLRKVTTHLQGTKWHTVEEHNFN